MCAHHHIDLPQRIARLDELASNLWWSWHSQAHDLFRSPDPILWTANGRSPMKLLQQLGTDKLKAAAGDPSFLNLYDEVMSMFDTDMAASDTWFGQQHSKVLDGPVAYFTMELAIHGSINMPTYAGGLGVLAGDMCKEASDLGLPLVGMSYLYRQGYFRQRIPADGWQQEEYEHLNLQELPVKQITLSEERVPLAQVRLGDRQVRLAVWQLDVGRTTVYLLDTDVEGNTPEDRLLSMRLYTSHPEHRIQQEIVLGIGGVRVLRALGVKPAIWHANEGHTTFMILERVRKEVERGISFAEAVRKVRATSVFTTHTPVSSGTDIFPVELVEKYLHSYWSSLGIDRETFLMLGQQPGNNDQSFNMTVLGLKLSEHHNAVSQLHERITRQLWHGLWSAEKDPQSRISHVTNGVHVPTWVAPEMDLLYQKYLGHDWIKRHDDATLWEHVLQIPDEELWGTRRILRQRLMSTLLERARNGWRSGSVTPEQVVISGAFLDPEALTIGFARRFARYKRATLVMQDMERLKAIFSNSSRPVQIVFAGKAHPSDTASKDLLRHVFTLAKDPPFRGRIAFLENYDMHLAYLLIQGVDLWLNTPLRLQEASGTSGMKASLNGVVHASIASGWWYEGYNGANGWVIGDAQDPFNHADDDRSDAEALYRLLEQQIVPLYYERDSTGVPHGWIRMVKEAIRSIGPVFCARRMVKQYVELIYLRCLADRDKQG